MKDSYYNIGSAATSEIKVKGSRFIGEACKVFNEVQARKELQTIRKREHTATHHCYAWRVGHIVGMTSKYSDDGEPTGSAGKPIYDVIAGAELDDLLLVVTRYYGGTKLGTGGLARAYSETAKQTLERAGRVTCYLERQFALCFAFNYFDSIQILLQRLEARIESSNFTEQVRMVVAIRLSRADELLKSIKELTSRKGLIEEQIKSETD